MMESFPDTTIRGPELHDPVAIRALIAAADPDALATYQDGIARLRRVQALLAAAARLAELHRTRAFVQAQLAAARQQRPVAFAAACAAWHPEEADHAP